MSHRALIADPSPSSSSQLRHFLESAGCKVGVAHRLEESLEAVRGQAPDLLFAVASEGFDGETLSRKAKEESPRCAVVLLYGEAEEDPEAHASAAGADAYLVAPFKKGTVVSCARSMLRLAQLAEKVGHLEADLKRHVAEPGKGASFAFFKRFLLTEVKRSRRYKIPVSFLLVALDGFQERARKLKEKDVARTQALVLAAVTRCLRDIDLAVPAAQGRFLVFLPHTPRAGAVIVAQRLRERLSRLERLQATRVSVGLASYDGASARTPVSFGSLMKEATEALHRAQKAGGDRLELSAEGPKRDRIVIG